MLALAVDENFNNDIVRGLLRREPDLNIVRIQDAGLSGADDPTVLEWAAQQRRVIFTHDASTMTHHAYERVRNGRSMPGLFEVNRGVPMLKLLKTFCYCPNAVLKASGKVKCDICHCGERRNKGGDLSRSSITIRVGTRRWHAVLGGTDTLYFLIAYQYGLMTLSDKSQRHYPGLSIIDLPAEFSREAVEDKENFLVRPFVDLLTTDEYEGAQLIITGAFFAGLVGVHRLHLTHVYVA